VYVQQEHTTAVAAVVCDVASAHDIAAALNVVSDLPDSRTRSRTGNQRVCRDQQLLTAATVNHVHCASHAHYVHLNTSYAHNTNTHRTPYHDFVGHEQRLHQIRLHTALPHAVPKAAQHVIPNPPASDATCNLKTY
jgi:hypothetical protein